MQVVVERCSRDTSLHLRGSPIGTSMLVEHCVRTLCSTSMLLVVERCSSATSLHLRGSPIGTSMLQVVTVTGLWLRIMATDYGYGLWLRIMATDYGYGLWLRIMATDYGYRIMATGLWTKKERPVGRPISG